MPEFKNIIFLFGFCIIFHTGCFLFPPGDDDSPKTTTTTKDHPCIQSTSKSQGNITVSEITGELQPVSSPNGLPEKFTLKLKACIKGPQIEELPLAYFWISSNEENIITYEKDKDLQKKLNDTENSLLANNGVIQVEADNEGCLNWIEEYKYTYNKKSQWLVSNRFITGRSQGFRGTHLIPLIVNPWLQLSEHKEVQDYRPKYRDGSIEQYVNETECLTQTVEANTEIANKNAETANIIVDKVDFTGRQRTENNKRYIQVSIDAHVKYIIKDIYGKPTDMTLDRGEFVIKPQLLMTQNKKINGAIKPIYTQLNENVQEIKAQFRENVLASDVFDWEIPKEAYDFPITLYLQVIPVGKTAEQLNTFEGIYRIGEYLQNIVGEKALSLNQKLNEYYRNKISPLTKSTDSLSITTAESGVSDPLVACVKEQNNINQMVIEQCVSKKGLTIYTDGSQEPGWRTGEIRLSFQEVHAENWLSRTIQTLVRTNIFDPFDIDRKSGRDIDITVTDLTTGKVEEPQQPETEGDGNITFTISTSQNWYKKQRYFLKLIHFSNPTDKMNLYKIIAINPWDYGFTHGYDVTQSQSLSTTCLNKSNNNEERKKQHETVKQLFEDIAKSNDSVPTSFDPTLIKQIFCYEDGRPTNETHVSNWWVDKFKEIKKILSAPFREEELKGAAEPDPDELTDAFFTKFDSSMKKTAPQSFIHLFRSLNRYPTYLIDSSLDRDLYYNMVFTITPRVVRYDDIRAGQQNKGPIRDGVFLFQMAVLKNEQEKSDGFRNMVQVNANPSIIYTQFNGNVPLFSCIKDRDEKTENQDCLTEEDFLIPPVNIPVIIRDGTMKTDIKYLIQRKNLIFANSKNELVFRILPADPDSIVCKGTCLPISNVQYEANVDWEATSKSAKPAKLKDYDIVFHTYRTPFIPSEWNNWTIPNEIDLQFNELSDFYKAFSDRNTPEAKSTDQKMGEEIQQGISFVNQEEKAGQSIANNPEIDMKLVKNHSEQLDQQLTQVRAQLSDAQLRKHSEIKELPENSDQRDTQNVQDIIPENISTLEQTSKTEKDFCIDVNQANNHQEDIRIYKDKSCEPGSADRMTAHLSYFVRNNSLCVIDINSDGTQMSELSEESCGNFSDTNEAQTSFMNELNQQIAIINDVGQKVKDNSMMPPNGKSSTVEYLANTPNSSDFKNKIRKLPKLSYLNEADIEKIIKDGITKSGIHDENTSTFIHALCGVWFDQLLSKKYTNPDLLLNGFRRSMKKTLYYNLRGLSLPEDQGKEGEEQQFIQKINENIATLRANYNDHLAQQNLSGHIDSIHNWIDDERDDSFDFSFHRNLREQFSRVAHATPLNAEGPSWKEPSIWDKTVAFVTGEDNKDTDASKGFQLADYLYEAVKTQERYNAESWSDYLSGLSRPSKSDLHPVRKCISNPFHFFGFEKKVIVGEVGEDSRYGDEEGKGGTITTLNISKEFLLNSQKEQGGRQGFETNIIADAFIIALPLFLLATTGVGALFTGVGLAKFGAVFGGGLAAKTGMTGYILSHLLTVSLMTGAGYNYQSYESVSRDKMMTVRVSRGVRLIVEQTPKTIHLSKYKECLVVRPRFSAFETYTGKYEHIWATDNKILRSIYENIGVLLCSNGTDPERKITEQYYYVYPDTAINGVSANPLSIHNKPFIISLRGQNEWNKFKDSLACYITEGTSNLNDNYDCMDPAKGDFDYLFNKKIEFADNLRTGFNTPRLMHLTGHSPGVHSVEVTETDMDDISPSRTTAQKFMNFWAERSMMDMDIEGIIRNDTEIQNE